MGLSVLDELVQMRVTTCCIGFDCRHNLRVGGEGLPPQGCILRSTLCDAHSCPSLSSQWPLPLIADQPRIESIQSKASRVLVVGTCVELRNFQRLAHCQDHHIQFKMIPPPTHNTRCINLDMTSWNR